VLVACAVIELIAIDTTTTVAVQATLLRRIRIFLRVSPHPPLHLEDGGWPGPFAADSRAGRETTHSRAGFEATTHWLRRRWGRQKKENQMTTTSPEYRTQTGTTSVRSNVERTRRTFTETKAFYKTSEFLVWLASVVGVLVVTYIDDSASLSNWHGWLLVTVLSAAYMFSRGIAKSGSHEPYREHEDY
jgi:hypothetical protein